MKEEFLLSEIVIQRVLAVEGESDDVVTVEARTPSGDLPPLIELLGMLRMAEDTLIRDAMGEVP
jgi:hypothetical protein